MTEQDLYHVVEGADPYDPAKTDIWHVVYPALRTHDHPDSQDWADTLAAFYAVVETRRGAQPGARVRVLIQTAAGEKIAESKEYVVGVVEE